MKKLFLIAILFAGCIETDLQAPLAETLRVVLSGETFRVGETYSLQSEFVNSDGEIEDVPVEWMSSDPSVFSVNGDQGMGVAVGTVILTLRAEGLEATEEITIESTKESLQITTFVNMLQVGNEFAMSVNYLNADGNAAAPEVLWTSSDLSVATISSEGVVTALMAGTTTIRATASMVFDEIELTVTDDAVVLEPEVRLTEFVQELEVGETFMFQANYFGTDGQPDNSQTITWISRNASLITIDANGLATGVAEGATTIEASANGVSADVVVTVVPAVSEMRTGSLMGTGYDISGNFSMEYNEDNDLILTVTNYMRDGPGPYFYLTNQTTNVTNGLNLGSAQTNGNHTINVSEIARNESVSVDLFTYDVLMVWCEPFSVRLGFGEFDN